MVAVAKVTFEDPSRVARGSVLVWVDGQPVTLTEKGWALLLSIGKGRYVRGAEVATTRKLVDGCLATLRDDGAGPLHAGRVDGERWWVEMSALGSVIVNAHKRDREALKLVASSSIWFPTRGARDEQRDLFVDLCTRGFVSQRLSSIGEVDEKVHFSISDAGRKALAG